MDEDKIWIDALKLRDREIERLKGLIGEIEPKVREQADRAKTAEARIKELEAEVERLNTEAERLFNNWHGADKRYADVLGRLRTIGDG